MILRVISVKSKDKKSSSVEIKAFCEADGKERQYIVSEGTYREIGCPLSGDLLEEETIELIKDEDEKRRALQKLFRILEYADNNLYRARQKLRAAGFGKESLEYALGEALRLGYIDERRQLSAKIPTLACRKLLGPHRIYAKLSSEGYSRRDVREVMSELIALGEVDFDATRTALLEKLCPADEEEKRKILYKYGYYND